MTHEQAMELAVRALERVPDAAEQAALDAHLGACAECRREVAALRSMHAELGAWGVAAAAGASGPAAAIGAPAARAVPAVRAAPSAPRWWPLIAALFVGIVIGGAGGATAFRGGNAEGGEASASPPTGGAPDARATFALLLEEPAAQWPPTSPLMRGGYFEWLDTLVARGQYAGGERLSEDAGWYIPAGGAPVPANVRGATAANFSGMFLVRARDYDEAVRIASESPHLRYGGVLVRKTY